MLLVLSPDPDPGGGEHFAQPQIRILYICRYFYQSLQETRVKLAVSPQPRAVGEPVAVNTSQYLAVKVREQHPLGN